MEPKFKIYSNEKFEQKDLLLWYTKDACPWGGEIKKKKLGLIFINVVE